VDHAGSPNPSICHYFSNGDGDPSYGDCTNQTHEENLPEDFNGWYCRVYNWFGEGFPGHLNWFTSTYEGQASWTDSEADDDYDVALVSSGAPGVMTGRADLHTEFDADEMDIEHFVGPWWQAIYWAAEHGDKYAVKPVFAPNGSIPAIVTGMFGMDCEHDGCKSELHPVYAMAAHISNNQDNDAWAMFVRNNGDEGACSSRLVPQNFTSYTFHLPWRAGKTGVTVSLAGRPDQKFDHVVFACHGPQVLPLLESPTDIERDVLSGFETSANDVCLHSDSNLLPRRENARASWNYHINDHRDSGATVTYHAHAQAKSLRVGKAVRRDAPYHPDLGRPAARRGGIWIS